MNALTAPRDWEPAYQALDFRVLFAVGLFGSTRHATVVEVTPCHACATWGVIHHARAEVVREPDDTSDFFDAYLRGACPLPDPGQPSLAGALAGGEGRTP